MYPDFAPLVLKAPRDKVFAAAQGRIEATATSLLFGFKDDVVVRIADDGGVTKVDMHSNSRVGGNDSGINAKRLRAFRATLKAAGC